MNRRTLISGVAPNKTEMKIQLPNPSDFTVEQWFAQVRIVLKSAEKIYQKMVEDYGKENPEEGGNNPWVTLRLEETLLKSIEDLGIDIDDELPKNLYLEINHL